MDNARQCIAMTKAWSNENAEIESGSICSKQCVCIIIKQFGFEKVSIAVSKILLSEKVSNSKQSLGLSPDEYLDSSLSEYVCVVVRSV